MLRVGERYWADSGGYGQHILREVRQPDGTTHRYSEWIRLEAQPIDDERGTYLALKAIRSRASAACSGCARSSTRSGQIEKENADREQGPLWSR